MKLRSIIAVFLCCAILLSGIGLYAVAADAEDTPPVVYALEELEIAIEAAAEGDTIFVGDTIFLWGGDSIGDLGKHVVLRRAVGFDWGPIFRVLGTGDVLPATIQNLTIDGNLIETQSPAILATVDLIVESLVIRNCIVNYVNGAAVIFEQSTALINNSLFENNRTNVGGGHIFISGDASATISNSVFIEGRAEANGGAILSTGNLSISNSLFLENSATNGGAIYTPFWSEVTVEMSTFTRNSATASGGAIHTQMLTIESSRIYWNTAGTNGSDLSTTYSLTIKDSLDDLLSLFEDYEVTPVGWFLESEDAAGDINTEAFLTPTANASGLLNLVFLFEETPDVEPEPCPDLEDPPLPPNRPGGTPRPPVPPPPDVDEIPNENPLARGSAVLDLTKFSRLNGDGNGNFRPGDPITRAETAQLIFNLLTPESIAADHEYSVVFEDVSEAVWYYSAVTTLSNAGVFIGYNNRFNPQSNLTWAQLIVIFSRFTELPEGEIVRDDLSNHWARVPIAGAVATGWIEDIDTFEPNAAVARSEAVDFINKILDIHRQ